ncbi:MAG: PVC-type heme-binding CxxCH protein [Planctomycetaceae bacterium]
MFGFSKLAGTKRDSLTRLSARQFRKTEHPTPVFILALIAVFGATLPAAEPALKAPDGFRVSLFADDDLAHDIHCLTIDSRGRITVAGNGFIKHLIDTDGDGVADKSELFAEGPAVGVQGMCWHGTDLLAVGGEGLLRFRDRDGDDKADGPPDVLLKLKCGGEHHAHAIQRGPDGWWYLIAGNNTELNAKYVTLPNAPIKQPENGVLYRLKPDTSGGEVVAHGMRNAYDFAFNRMADAFTFDSDDERDVSLPWYRPTRVIHLLPGSHAGWVTRSWKRPDEFLDMPPVIASAGRGSPTGVVCYQHRQFPEKYREALFVLDWTFGRVLALPLVRHGSAWKTESELFLSATGDHGFAPTDIEVGPDGSLFVSVGGRGTRGGVWQVSYPKAPDSGSQATEESSATEKLAACVTAPQPLSSWSRARWQPLARQLGREPFLETANNDALLPAVRLRAIDILTELFGGLDTTEAIELSKATPAEVRAKAIWSLGRTHANLLDVKVAKTFLEDRDLLVSRAALEAILSADIGSDWSPLVDGLVQQLGSDDRFNRLTASRLLVRLDPASFQTLSQAIVKAGWQATLMYAVGYLPRSPAATRYALKISLNILDGDHSPSLKLQAARLLQLALGDMVPASGIPAFEAYSTKLDLSAFERDLDPLRIRLVETFPTGDADVDRELSRALAMLSLANTKLLDRVLAKITDETHPVEDLHYLLVAARIPTSRNRAQADAIARGLIRLEPKIRERKLTQDLHWDDRVGELFRELAKLDDDLADQLVAQPEFGRPGHVLFLSQLPQDLLPKVIDSYVKAVTDDVDYPWTNDVVFLIGESKQPEHRDLLRRQFDQFQIRGAVLVILAQQPEERDRDKFVEGLEESRLEVLTACADALTKFKPSQVPAEQISLLRALRRLGSDEKEFPIRDKIAKLLTRNLNRDFGFVFGQPGYRPQAEAVQRWTDYLTQKYPTEAARVLGGDAETLTWLTEQLALVDWPAGDAERGRKLFEKRSCAQCHGGRQGLGPDLAGATSRFARNDVFLAIALPNRDVSTRYQTTLIETKQGKVHTGLIVYESAEGVLLRNSTNQTHRIETRDVETRRTLPQSLMPSGLLKDFRSADFADLFAYLKSLSGSGTPATTAK